MPSAPRLMTAWAARPFKNSCTIFVGGRRLPVLLLPRQCHDGGCSGSQGLDRKMGRSSVTDLGRAGCARRTFRGVAGVTLAQRSEFRDNSTLPCQQGSEGIPRPLHPECGPGPSLLVSGACRSSLHGAGPRERGRGWCGCAGRQAQSCGLRALHILSTFLLSWFPKQFVAFAWRDHG